MFKDTLNSFGLLILRVAFGCFILLIVGFLTRLATVPLAITMLVALFVVHGADPWQKKELAACYLAVYLTLFFTGPGVFSVDHLVWRRKKEELQV